MPAPQKLDGIYLTHGKQQLTERIAWVNGQKACAYIDGNGRLISYEPYDSYINKLESTQPILSFTANF